MKSSILSENRQTDTLSPRLSTESEKGRSGHHKARFGEYTLTENSHYYFIILQELESSF
ncbi:hypothetical protein C1752_02138 [Acaryochloris thomasi RCC1774]|uniref:Uncharacterized protein n=1 Tax=Acaryochloris thomasi RCC1774 TaxID=1764569 RepID=A0A2W1JJV5_9CYAN|nr:hypothetical protein C1752_02138 [Acaryochloris thomasi RCC1774]